MSFSSNYKYVIIVTFVALANVIMGQKIKLSVVSDNEINVKKRFSKIDLAEKYLKGRIDELRKKGYAEANIDSLKLKSDTLFAFIHKGEKYAWDTLKFENIPTEVISEINARNNKIKNMPFDASFPRKIGEGIIGFYENTGYPFGRVSYDSILFDDNRVTMKIKLEKGPLVKIDSISIKGDLKINPFFIYYTIGIKPGDVYNEKKIKTIGKNLNSIAFLDITRNQQIFFTKKFNILFLYLKPRKTNSFSGILGFQNDPETNKLMLTGDISLSLNNVFKQGEWIRLKWNQFQAQSQRLNLIIGFPYIFKSPIGIEGSIKLLKQDTTYLDTRFEAGLLFNFGANSRMAFSIESRNSNTLLINPLPVSDLNDLSIINYSLSFTHQGFDYIFNPRKGIGGFIKLSVGNIKTKTDPTNENPVPDPLQYQGVADVRYFIPIFRKQTIGLFFKGGGILNSVIYDNEMFRLGGLNSIRGFNEDAIFANQYAIFSFEYRYLYEKNANLSVFFDGAYVQNINSLNINSYPIGFGIGASIETKAGNFKLDYAMGKYPDEKIKLSDAKVHFGYVNTF